MIYLIKQLQVAGAAGPFIAAVTSPVGNQSMSPSFTSSPVRNACGYIAYLFTNSSLARSFSVLASLLSLQTKVTLQFILCVYPI